MTDDTPAESGWFWRRSFTFTATLINLILAAAVIWKVDEPQALKWLGLALIGSNVVLAGFYLGGASVESYARLAAAWKGGKSEETKVETSAGTVTQTTTETKPAEIER